MTPGRAPLPTLRDRKAEEKRRQLGRDRRIAECLRDAKTHLAYDRHSSAFADVLVAVELSYGLGKTPDEITKLLDQLNLMREESFA